MCVLGASNKDGQEKKRRRTRRRRAKARRRRTKGEEEDGNKEGLDSRGTHPPAARCQQAGALQEHLVEHQQEARLAEAHDERRR